MDAIRFDIRLKLVLIGIVAAILLFLPTAVQGANNVVSNTTQNSTSFTTTATWTEIVGSNRTITTGTGNTSIIVSIASRINLSGKVLYARVMRDGSEIGRYNITASPFESSTAFMVVQEETAGIHQYGLEVYSTAGSQATVYRWSMTVLYLLTGEYLGSVAGYITNTSAQITAGQVTGLPGTLNLMNGSAETNDTYRQNNDSSIRAAMALQNQSNEANNTYRQNNDTATRNAMTLQNQSQDTNNTSFRNTVVFRDSSS